MTIQKLKTGWLLFLPLPPSTNARMRPVRMGRFCRDILTSEARKYIESVGNNLAIWRKMAKVEPINYWKVIDLWFILPRTSADNHNYQKCLWDAFEVSGLVTNDKYIIPRVQGVYHDKNLSCVIIKVDA